MLTIVIRGRMACGRADNDPITSGSVGYPVHFDFSPEWEDLIKNAVFIGSGITFEVPLINTDETIIPHEVLADAGSSLLIGAYGATPDGAVVMPTVYVRVGQINAGAVPPIESPSVPTPSWAVQVQAAAENTLSAAEGSAEDAEAWAVGERNGEPVTEDDPTYHNNAKYYAEQGGGPGGAVQSVNGKTGHVELNAEDVDALPSGTTLDEISDGATYKRATAAQLRQIADNAAELQAQDGKIEALESGVADIEAVIPNQATPQNQLADKSFVNSSINSSAAFFRGAFATRAALFAVAWQTADPSAANYVSNNDYAYVADDETHDDEAWRYIYVLQPGGTSNGWQPQFRVNESPLTAAQLAALNSGATAELIEQISKNAAAIALKYTKPAVGIPAEDLAPGVIPSVPAASSTTPLMDGNGSAGSAATYARADHVHPGDTSKADKVTEVTVSTAGAVTQALDAGKIYHFTGALTALTITLNTPASGQLAHYHFDFDSGSTAPTLTIPQTVTMPSGFTVKASKHYEIDILNNYGAVMAW